MFNRFSNGARAAVTAGLAEAGRLGQRQINSDHLLLGLLHDPASSAGLALGVDLSSARAARAGLDHEALIAVGIDISELGELEPLVLQRRRVRITPAAADVLRRSLREAVRSHSRMIEPTHLLLGLLDAPRPDPVADLLTALDVDLDAVRARLTAAA